MRCKEMSAFHAVLSVLLMVSALALGSFAPAPQPAGPVAHSPSVSVFDTSGPSMPLEGVDGDATLQQRHKAGNTTASSPVQAGAPSSPPDLHDCASDIVRQHASPPGSRSPVRLRILRC